MKPKFNWSIEIYVLANNHLLILVADEEKENVYSCEMYSLINLLENFEEYSNGNMELDEFYDKVYMDMTETTINIENDDVDSIITSPIIRYISGWDSSYYEDAFMGAISEIQNLIEADIIRLDEVENKY